MSLRVLISEQGVAELANDIERRLSGHPKLTPFEYAEEVMESIGEGSWSKVFEISDYPDKVLRISEGDDYMEWLLGKDFPNVVKVFYHKIFYKKQFTLVIMEKLVPLSHSQYQILEKLETYYDLNDLRDLNVQHATDPEELFDFLDDQWHYEHDFDEIMDICHEIAKYHSDLIIDIHLGIQQLRSINITHSDLYVYNIMADPKTGNAKLIDIT